MSKLEKTFEKILLGQSDANIAFQDLIHLLLAKGFKKRQKGSHLIFTKEGVTERINLQADGAKAKKYQVKQVRNVLTQNADKFL